MNTYELGIKSFNKALARNEIPHKVFTYYRDRAKKSGANEISFSEGWNLARKEYYQKFKEKLRPTMEFILALRLKESEYYLAYRDGYEAGKEYIANATYDIPVLSTDEVRVLLEDGDLLAIELSEGRDDLEEQRAFYIGFSDALKELSDQYFHDKTIEKNSKIKKSLYFPSTKERLEIAVENLPTLMQKILDYLATNDYYSSDFEYNLRLLYDTINELLVLLGSKTESKRRQKYEPKP